MGEIARIGGPKLRKTSLRRPSHDAVGERLLDHLGEQAHEVDLDHAGKVPEGILKNGFAFLASLFKPMNVPADLKYTESHEWVRLEGDIATVGITDHAQSELGDVVYVDLPTTGRKIAKGESVGSVESVKTVSDIYAPIGGEVIASNASLAVTSELVNSDPYGEGYLFKVKVSSLAEFDSLLDAAAYQAVVG